MFLNHIGVTTIERFDQGHLYALGEHRDKHVTVEARTSDPLHPRRVLYLKSYLNSFLLAIRNLYNMVISIFTAIFFMDGILAPK
jgi:hypothetical protein